MAKSEKPIIAGILSLVIPGLGQLFIGSKYALHYFGIWIAVAIVTFALVLMSMGICSPLLIVPLSIRIISAIDAYYEARGQRGKRLLKEYIK